MISVEKIKSVYNLGENDKVLGTTNSTWSWEYDTRIAYATLILNMVTQELKLLITMRSIKTGLGQGDWTKFDSCHKVGTLKKINKALIRRLLAEKKMSSTFRKDGWTNPECDQTGCMMDLINNNKLLQRKLKVSKLKEEIKPNISKVKEESNTDYILIRDKKGDGTIFKYKTPVYTKLDNTWGYIIVSGKDVIFTYS
jgi:hypothetical protein